MVRARFARSTGLPFANVLTEANILDVLNDHGIKYRDRVFNPVTTIWGFLSQVLSDDHSCRDAVARVIAHKAASGARVCSPNTASYCNARSRLRTDVLRTLAMRTAQELQAGALQEWKWNGRQIGNLYERRWEGEVDIRSIKSTMKMDVLRCKTPEMVRKEIWTHLLAYNLLRTVMAVAAAENGIEPRQVSFKGAKQAVTAFAPKIEVARSEGRTLLIDAMLTTIAYHRVGNRTGRWEPRARKRRPKPGVRLMQSRAIARLLQNRAKQAADRHFIIDDNMKISAGEGDVAVPCGRLDLGQ